jgi:hypothetical protein
MGKLGAESEGHIIKYSFVNRTIQLRNQLPADVQGLSPVNQVILEKGLGK